MCRRKKDGFKDLLQLMKESALMNKNAEEIACELYIHLYLKFKFIKPHYDDGSNVVTFGMRTRNEIFRITVDKIEAEQTKTQKTDGGDTDGGDKAQK